MAERPQITVAVSAPVFVRQFLGERLYQFLAVLGARLSVLLFFHDAPADILICGNHGGVHGSVCRIPARVDDLLDVVDYLREVCSDSLIEFHSFPFYKNTPERKLSQGKITKYPRNFCVPILQGRATGFMHPDAAPAPDARRAKKPPIHSGRWGMLRLRRAKRRIERTEKQDTKDWRRTYLTGRRFYLLPYTVGAGLCAVTCFQRHARPSAAAILVVKGHATAIIISFSYLEIAG